MRWDKKKAYQHIQRTILDQEYKLESESNTGSVLSEHQSLLFTLPLLSLSLSPPLSISTLLLLLYTMSYHNIDLQAIIRQQQEQLVALQALLYVMATTYHKGQMITQAINLSNGISSGKFTRELDKEPLLNQCPIYTDCSWSVLQLSNPTLMSMLHPYVCLTSSSRPPCVLHVP